MFPIVKWNWHTRKVWRWYWIEVLDTVSESFTKFNRKIIQIRSRGKTCLQSFNSLDIPNTILIKRKSILVNFRENSIKSCPKLLLLRASGTKSSRMRGAEKLIICQLIITVNYCSNLICGLPAGATSAIKLKMSAENHLLHNFRNLNANWIPIKKLRPK